MSIDWTKAPEGATHFDPEDNSESCWMMEIGKRAWAFYDTECWVSIDYSEVAHDIKNYIPRPAKPAAPEWNGEGLPPVGCECELKRGDEWVPVKITGKGERVTVFRKLESFMEYITEAEAHEFRSLRTAEQRQREELVTAAIQACPYPGSETTKIDVWALMDAGFLKMPKSNDELKERE